MKILLAGSLTVILSSVALIGVSMVTDLCIP
jgi:hypothetical protein